MADRFFSGFTPEGDKFLKGFTPSFVDTLMELATARLKADVRDIVAEATKHSEALAKRILETDAEASRDKP